MTPAQQLTHAIKDYLTLKGWLVWKNSAGARKIEGGRFVKWGQVGLPDIMAIRKSVILACKVKAGKDRLSPEQQAWLDALAAHGAISVVARNVDDVMKAIGDIP